MATFQSGHRRVGGGTATARSRRVFEGNEERPASSGTAGRYRATGDRSNDTASRISNLNINDETTKTEVEDNPVDVEQTENATEEEEKSSKSHKKDRGGASANSARKRQARKNLREKRRSTGVVIMPDQPVIVCCFFS